MKSTGQRLDEEIEGKETETVGKDVTPKGEESEGEGQEVEGRPMQGSPDKGRGIRGVRGPGGEVRGVETEMLSEGGEEVSAARLQCGQGEGGEHRDHTGSVGSSYSFWGVGRGQSQPGLPGCTFQSWPQVHIIWECLIHSDYFIPGGCKQLLSGGESGRERVW